MRPHSAICRVRRAALESLTAGTYDRPSQAATTPAASRGSR